MTLKIKSIIPVRYSQDEIESLCSTFGVTYSCHTQSDYSIDLTIVEDLDSNQINTIKSGLIQYILSKVIEIEQ